MNNLITQARHIPIPSPVPTITINPVTLPAPDRGLPLELRVTAQVTGDKLPIILLSHGHGPSLYIPSKDGYGPLVDFYAAHGFVVIQPTHLNSKVAGLDPSAAGGPAFWRSRVEDMKTILDQLDQIEAGVPTLAGRLDRSKTAAIGHSLGGQTVGMLLGARLTDPHDASATDVNLIDPRITAGVLMAVPGNGDSLNPSLPATFGFMNPDFSHMTTQTLVIVGDADVNPHLTSRGAEWHADPFHHSPGSDWLLTLKGAKHGLGGVAGYDAKETDDEDPDRLAITQRLSWAYLRSALYPGDTAWANARTALQTHASEQGKVEQK